MQKPQSTGTKRDLLVLENKYHLGERFYGRDGSIDHKSLLIDRLFSEQPVSRNPQAKPKPDFCAVQSSLRSLS